MSDGATISAMAKVRRRQPEAALQRAIVAHLQMRPAPNIFWCHYPAGGGRTAIEGAILKGLGTRAGVPDLLLVRNEKLYALELKAPKGRLSRAQKDTIAQLQAAGAVVAVAYDIDTALERLTHWGFLRGRVQ